MKYNDTFNPVIHKIIPKTVSQYTGLKAARKFNAISDYLNAPGHRNDVEFIELTKEEKIKISNKIKKNGDKNGKN